MLADSDLRQSMGHAGKQRLAEFYSPARHCDGLLGILGALIEGKEPTEIADDFAQATVCSTGQ